jgi:hypothetical protein
LVLQGFFAESAKGCTQGRTLRAADRAARQSEAATCRSPACRVARPTGIVTVKVEPTPTALTTQEAYWPRLLSRTLGTMRIRNVYHLTGHNVVNVRKYEDP